MPVVCPAVSTFIQEYEIRIHNDSDEDTRAIRSCGLCIVNLIREISADLSSCDVSRLAKSRATARTLLSLADDRINVVDFFKVHSKWLMLYTDASLLLAAVTLCKQSSDSEAASCVRRLDLAIIIAGAAGSDRPRWLASLMREAQSRMQLRPPEPARERGKKRKAGAAVDVAPRTSPYARLGVAELLVAPTMQEYLAKYCTQPFIIRGFAGPDSPTAWPALHRWSSAEYLLDAVGEGRVVPVECGEAYVDATWGQKIMPFRAFLARVGYNLTDAEGDPDDEGQADTLYLAQHSLFNQFPILERDFTLPDYVWAEPEADFHKPLERGPVVNVWVGNSERHPVSPAHTPDPHFNCYVQVLGRKRVWLAPPSVAPDMYAYGDGEEGMTSYMTNTSQVPIFRSQNLALFPKFSQNVVSMAREAILSPGDLLVMPPGWWHAMRGEGSGPGWSVSMWY